MISLAKFSSTLIITCLFAVLSFTPSYSVAQTKKATAFTTELRATQKQYGLNPHSPLISRIAATPVDIIKQFRDAGMSPTEHSMTKEERRMVAMAFASLPSLHQRVLKQHLKSISFLDNMPNTALTSPVTSDEEVNLYHITFRSGILHQTISDWVTEKELTCFSGGDSTISVSIQAGLLNALTYVLLHESTHVVDGSLQLISTDTVAGKPQVNAFTASFSNGVWRDIRTHDWQFTASLVSKSRFRPGGRRFLFNEATKVYNGLSQTPFVSLYSMSSWHEDLAELLTVYHLTKKCKQPFRIIVRQNGKEILQYEPMNSPLVQRRIVLLRRFYAKRHASLF